MFHLLSAIVMWLSPPVYISISRLNRKSIPTPSGLPSSPPNYPPRSPNSFAQSSYCLRPAWLTLGLMVARLATKSPSSMGRISSMAICSNASPSERSGPMAASLANAVISDPEKPEIVGQSNLPT